MSFLVQISLDVSLFVFTFLVTLDYYVSGTCSMALSICDNDTPCMMMYHSYKIECSQQLNGDATNCTNSCQQALHTLMSSKERIGESVVLCDHEGNGFHRKQQENIMSLCSNVFDAIGHLDSQTRISCLQAVMMCRVDTNCVRAINAYGKDCALTFQGRLKLICFINELTNALLSPLTRTCVNVQ